MPDPLAKRVVCEKAHTVRVLAAGSATHRCTQRRMQGWVADPERALPSLSKRRKDAAVKSWRVEMQRTPKCFCTHLPPSSSLMTKTHLKAVSTL